MADMNVVALIGNLTKDVEIKKTQNGKDMANFTVAVNSSFKDKDGNYTVNFINCVAFSYGANFLNKYAKKGTKISVVGSITTGSYTNKDGATVYTTQVNAREVSIVSKSEKTTSEETANDIFIDEPNDDMPF